MAKSNRALFTIRNGLDARRVDAQSDQVIFDRVRAAFAECKVVFTGAALVGMTFNNNFVLRIFLQPSGLQFEGATCFTGKIVFVETKEDAVTNVDSEPLRAAFSQ